MVRSLLFSPPQVIEIHTIRPTVVQVVLMLARDLLKNLGAAVSLVTEKHLVHWALLPATAAA